MPSLTTRASTNPNREGGVPMETSAKILVVDDERINLELCARKLNRSGYLVDLALSGPQAMEMAQRSHYDVVLLDYMMPGMSGVEVLKALRLRHDSLELAIKIGRASCRERA